MRKIALLGGTGFVGKQLAQQLIKIGWQVKILTRRRERHRELLVLPNLQLVTANVHDLEQLKAQLADCEAVVNLVGILNEAGRDGAGFSKAHLELAQNVVAACQANNIKRLLQMSALNADRNGASHYLRTKGEAEDMVHACQDLAVTSFRPSVIFGENDSFFNKFAKLLRIPSRVFTLPSAEAKFAPVWVNDVVDAMIATLDNPIHYGQRYNLCGPQVYTLKELVALTARWLGVKRYIIGLKDKGSYWAARTMEFIPGKPYSMDNYLSAKMESVCGENNHFAQLGITPQSLEMIMPKYFTPTTSKAFYSQFRCKARR
jgi:NADH dehydrogenase